ncbi:zinc finger protein 346-like isoform X1 [Cynara cardunculus var. scolymus]|uniref:Zinc finger, C2H2-like protein n=1 Tax=Cynara cardunculus var. scolymus TaxID=59895 RepID=A0A124SE81_CYNCS|nr:zinc finger protein 346-like isoform X1 [Cynara cardunculus var. scolymus]KVH99262.1 Zinc finger, C2H2-like protein [Cynara cardunculus var. scolymus]
MGCTHFEPDRAVDSLSGIVSQTTDSTTCEHGGGTLSETKNVSTVMQSAGNSGVWTQHVVNDVIITSWQAESSSQPMQCEVCNITCTSGDVLEIHKKGKKHLKNLQKLAITALIAPQMPPVAPSAPLVGVLENKKHKLLQNGASVDTLIYCDICNVVCNNQDVFRKHLDGKKHSAKAAARLADVNEISNPTSECVPEAQPSNGGSQMKPDTLQPARCELCNISCTSNEGLSVHLTGKKHLKKLLESDQIPDPSLTPIASLGTPPTKPMENLESTEGKSVISHEGKPAWCELCGIDCNTYDGLRNHIWGKKHQKKLEISEKPIGPNPAPATLQDSWKEEGKVVNVDGGNRKAKRVGNDEDLETKKQKVLKGGAASGAVRTCTVCNVVCNSPTVFISHLAGQKHAAMAVKQAETKSNGQET